MTLFILIIDWLKCPLGCISCLRLIYLDVFGIFLLAFVRCLVGVLAICWLAISTRFGDLLFLNLAYY